MQPEILLETHDLIKTFGAARAVMLLAEFRPRPFEIHIRFKRRGGNRESAAWHVDEVSGVSSPSAARLAKAQIWAA